MQNTISAMATNIHIKNNYRFQNTVLRYIKISSLLCLLLLLQMEKIFLFIFGNTTNPQICTNIFNSIFLKINNLIWCQEAGLWVNLRICRYVCLQFYFFYQLTSVFVPIYECFMVYLNLTEKLRTIFMFESVCVCLWYVVYECAWCVSV